MIGKRKKDVFAFVIDIVWKIIQGWNRKRLSRACKEILIKTVAQAIPNYVMSVYLLPLDTCADLEQMLIHTSGVPKARITMRPLVFIGSPMWS